MNNGVKLVYSFHNFVALNVLENMLLKFGQLVTEHCVCACIHIWTCYYLHSW